jgi:hypothetical protein
MRCGSLGAIHRSWLSLCGVRIALNVLPPSVDLWNDTLLTYTVFVSFGSAWIFV